MSHPTAYLLAAAVRVVAVAAGRDHSAAVTCQGDLFVWGSNELGQLGIEAPSAPHPTRVRFATAGTPGGGGGGHTAGYDTGGRGDRGRGGGGLGLRARGVAVSRCHTFVWGSTKTSEAVWVWGTDNGQVRAVSMP